MKSVTRSYGFLKCLEATLQLPLLDLKSMNLSRNALPILVASTKTLYSLI